MAQGYSNPAREALPHALPDVETFYVDEGEQTDENGEPLAAGYYWHACFPGCLPDGEPVGPFDTEREALDDAQSNAGDDEGDE